MTDKKKHSWDDPICYWCGEMNKIISKTYDAQFTAHCGEGRGGFYDGSLTRHRCETCRHEWVEIQPPDTWAAGVKMFDKAIILLSEC